MDLTSLELVLKKKAADQKQKRSAVAIQTMFRAARTRAWYKKVKAIRAIAANRIQLWWKVTLNGVIRPQRNYQQNLPKIELVQRYCRGYLARKSIINELSELKINQTYEYFKEIHSELQESAVRMIVRNMRQFARQRREDRMKKIEVKAGPKRTATMSTRNVSIKSVIS